MLFEHMLSIGVDLSGRKPVYAALDHDLRPVALMRSDMDDMLAFFAGQSCALAAINVPLAVRQSPVKGNAGRLQAWAQRASRFCGHLHKAGYRPYALDEAPLQLLETNMQTVFLALLGRRALPRHSLEGRLQRQVVLYEEGVKLADPMEFFEEITRRKILLGALPLDMVYSSEQLDALGAAYVAWLASTQPERLIRRAEALFVPLSRAGRLPAAG